jgi:GNAT superfamily N-acetyltransferase
MARVMRAAALAEAGRYPAGLVAAWGSLPALYHRWAMTAGGETRVVALAGGRVVGFAGWRGPEVTTLFVLPRATGRGVGARLLAAAAAGAAGGSGAGPRGGPRTLTLVAARSAVPFYLAHGWRDRGPAASPLPGGLRLPARRLSKAPSGRRKATALQIRGRRKATALQVRGRREATARRVSAP